MADIGSLLQVVGELVVPTAGPMIRAAVARVARTAVGMFVIAGAAAWASASVAAHMASPRAGFASALVSLALFAGVSVVLAAQQGMAGAARVGVERFGLGERISAAVFEHLLRDEAERAARMLEAIPLAQAERRLKDAVDAVSRARVHGGATGWVLRAVHRRLVSTVERLTLAQLRDENARSGSVDLQLVRERVADGIDGKIGALLEAASLKVTALWVLGAFALSLGAATAIGRALH